MVDRFLTRKLKNAYVVVAGLVRIPGDNLGAAVELAADNLGVLLAEESLAEGPSLALVGHGDDSGDGLHDVRLVLRLDGAGFAPELDAFLARFAVLLACGVKVSGERLAGMRLMGSDFISRRGADMLIKRILLILELGRFGEEWSICVVIGSEISVRVWRQRA